LSGGAEEPAAEASDELGLANARGDALAFQLARDFRLTGKQRQTVIEYCESHGRAYVLGKAEVRVGLGARQVIVCERTFRFAPSLCDSCAGAREVKEQARKDPSRNRWERLCPG
jgi:hypothetical protein